MCCNILCILEDHIGLIITCFALVFAFWVYLKDKRDNDKKKLAKQVIAFYALEQEAVKEIKTHTKDNAKTIMVRLRKAAQQNDNNLENEYPSMTAKAARRYFI